MVEDPEPSVVVLLPQVDRHLREQQLAMFGFVHPQCNTNLQLLLEVLLPLVDVDAREVRL